MKPFYLVFGVIGLIYVVSPIDLIPEALLGPLGLVDDGLVGTVAIIFILAGLGDEESKKKAKKYS